MSSIMHILQRNKTYLAVIGISVGGYLFKCAFNLLLVQYLTPQDYGDFSIALRFLTMLATVALLGTDDASKRFLSFYLKKMHADLKSYVAWNMRVVSVSFLFFLGIGIFAFVTMHLLHIWGMRDIDNYHVTVYMLWVTPLAALFGLLGDYILCTEDAVTYNLLRRLRSLVFILFFFCFFMILHITVRGRTFAYMLALSFLFLLLLELVFISIKKPILFQHMVDAFPLSRKLQLVEAWIGVSRRLGMNNMMYVLIGTIDLFIVKFFYGDSNRVALYAVALTLASAVCIIPQNLYSILRPKMTTAISSVENKKYFMDEHVMPLNRWACFFACLVGGGIWIFAGQLLAFFGTYYMQAITPLRILILAIALIGFTRPMVSMLVCGGYEKKVLQVTFLELMLLVFGGPVFLYYFDLAGMAGITLAAVAIKAGIFYWQVYRAYHIHMLRLW